MASGLVHEVHTFIVFGLPYGHIHKEKDAPSQKFPGLRHRNFRHGWYQAFGKSWTFANPFPAMITKKTERLSYQASPTRAEEYQVSISHDYFDRVWDYADRSREERSILRKCIEGWHVWVLFNPAFLKQWAGLDVLAGKIHFVIDGQEVWEEEPTVTTEYKRLRTKADIQLRRDTQLRGIVEEYNRQYDSRKVL
jgi:hypothetical protein